MRKTCSYALTLLATCALLAASAHRSFAQSDLASVNGVVRDPSGAVIPDAKITLRNEATAAELKTTTSAAGNYSITSVPAGTYTLIVESSGFKRFEQSRNRIDQGGLDLGLVPMRRTALDLVDRGVIPLTELPWLLPAERMAPEPPGRRPPAADPIAFEQRSPPQ